MQYRFAPGSKQMISPFKKVLPVDADEAKAKIAAGEVAPIRYKVVDKDYHNLILGVQGQLWSETITKPEYIDILINPRLACLSEVAWCSDNRRGWEKFKPSLMHNMKILSKLGWKYHDF